MGLSTDKIMGIALSLVLISILAPIFLTYLSTIDVQQIVVNGTTYTVGNEVDSSVLIMFSTILPLVAGIGFIGYYVKGKK